MKQIVDKLNKIAKAIDENVELSDRDLIIDSLDSITKAFGGTPNDSNLIVDKLDDIAGVAEPKPTGNIELTENAENVDIAQYATATVNVEGSGGGFANPKCTLTVINNSGNVAYLAMGINTYNDENVIYIMSDDEGAVPANTTKIVDIVSIPHVIDNDLIWSEYIVDAPGPVASDLVNCTFSSTLLEITDPTQDASLTLTIS